MIHCESPATVYHPKNVPYWLISTFKAGYINSAGFLLTGEFVSHLTGFGTRVGITIGHRGYFFGFELLMIPLSFILGGVVTSLILDRHYERHEIPPYHEVQSLITVLIGTLVIMGELKLFSDELQFGTDGVYSLYEMAAVFLLCFICGLKNALITWTTYGKIRVTHLTGLSTDIGLNFIRMFNKDFPGPRANESKIVNWIRILTFLFFSAGAFISAMIFPVLGLKTFLVAFALSLTLTIISFRKNAIQSGLLLTDKHTQTS